MSNLSAAWHLKGFPAEDEMPRWMLRETLRLRREYERRGRQLKLF